MRSSLILILCFIPAPFLRAQWDVQYEILSVEEYVQQYLVEAGSLVTNIEFTGDPQQVILGTNLGTFGLGLPFDTGLFLTNHWAQSSVDTDFVPPFYIDAYTPPAFSGPFTYSSGGVYSDLLQLSNNATEVLNALDENGDPIFNLEIFDVACIEFDIVPTSDTLSFQYLMHGGEFTRSESCYPNPYGFSYASCEYNDVFGIFISGPGIEGTFSSPSEFPDGAINIASLPGNDPELPMTSISVNDSTNASWYISPCDSSMNVECNSAQYTGLIQNYVPVICGQQYHIRIAIGDVFDHIYGWDAVMGPIGGTAYNPNIPQITFSWEPGGETIYDVYEDCGPVYLNLNRSDASDLSQPDTLILDFLGETIAGIDYSILPDSIVIPAGQLGVILDVVIVDDGITEFNEELIISCLELNNAEPSCLVYSLVEFHDGAEPMVVIGDTIPICGNSQLILEPVVSGGYGQYQYVWFNSQTGTELNVEDPVPGFDYFVVVSDACDIPADTAHFSIFATPDLMIEMPQDSIAYGCNMEIIITPQISGGYGQLQYYWSPYGPDEPEYSYPTFAGPGTVQLTVEDECGNIAQDSVVIYSSNGIPLTNNTPLIVYSGCDSIAEVLSQGSGGFDPYQYYWLSPFGFDAGADNSYALTDTLIVTAWVFDACTQFVMNDVTLIPGPEPLTLAVADTLNVTCLDILSIIPVVSGGEGTIEFEWNIDGEFISADGTLTLQQLTENHNVNLQITDECGQTVIADIFIGVSVSLPDADLPEDMTALCSDELIIPAEVSGGNGQLTYTWFINGQEDNNETEFFQSQFPGSSVLQVEVIDECGFVTSDSMLIAIISVPLIASDTLLSFCDAQSVSIPIPYTGGNFPLIFEWDNVSASSGVVEYFAGNSGILEVIITDACAQSDTAFIITEINSVDADFTTDETGWMEYQFEVSDTCEACSYTWQLGNESAGTGPVFSWLHEGSGEEFISLLVVGPSGCRDSSSTIIEGESTIYIPNAFSPDGDGVNDVWQPEIRGYEKISIRIYSRWGELVFESTVPDPAWTGNFQGHNHFVAEGVYVYVIVLDNGMGNLVNRTGSVTVIR